jgi:hypothetical protein
MPSVDMDRRNGEFRPEGPVSHGKGDPAPGADTPVAVDDTMPDELARVQAERDEYLDLARRTRAVRQRAEAQGLERIGPAGEPFRPEEHEAVVYRNGAVNEDPGVVAGRLLRPASVAVTGGRG